MKRIILYLTLTSLVFGLSDYEFNNWNIEQERRHKELIEQRKKEQEYRRIQDLKMQQEMEILQYQNYKEPTYTPFYYPDDIEQPQQKQLPDSNLSVRIYLLEKSKMSLEKDVQSLKKTIQSLEERIKVCEVAMRGQAENIRKLRSAKK